eukprot:352066-Amphidinium_carterae.1
MVFENMLLIALTRFFFVLCFHEVLSLLDHSLAQTVNIPLFHHWRCCRDMSVSSIWCQILVRFMSVVFSYDITCIVLQLFVGMMACFVCKLSQARVTQRHCTVSIRNTACVCSLCLSLNPRRESALWELVAAIRAGIDTLLQTDVVRREIRAAALDGVFECLREYGSAVFDEAQFLAMELPTLRKSTPTAE